MVDLTVLGTERDVRARAAALGLTLPGVRIVDPLTSPDREDFAATYHELRKHKGVTADMAFDQMGDVSYFGTMMIYKGLADGMVSGAAHTTAHTIRPAFEFIRTAPGRQRRLQRVPHVPGRPRARLRRLRGGARTRTPRSSPTSRCPRPAPRRCSGSSRGWRCCRTRRGSPARARTSTGCARRRRWPAQLRPDLPIEGPIQYDAAVDPDVARTKLPGSAVAGRATVFVFPDLNTGNNTYKAVQRSAGAVAIGPVLQGLNKPVNDLSRGALVPDIVNTVAITAVQAQNLAAARNRGAA